MFDDEAGSSRDSMTNEWGRRSETKDTSLKEQEAVGWIQTSA